MKIVKPFVKRIGEHNFSLHLHGRSTVAVKKGDLVRVGDVLFTREYKRILHSYSVIKELGVSADEAKEYVVRLEGEYVTTGEILAERLTKGGFVVKKIFATVDGLVSFERLSLGYIDILSEHIKEDVISKQFGKVVDIDHSSNVTIASRAFEIPTVSVWHGKTLEGEITVIGDGNSVYTERDLAEDYNDKIVFAGRFVYGKFVEELLKRGALAVIAWSIDYMDYENYKGRVVVIGGFGQIPYDYSIAHAIKSMDKSLIIIEENRLVCADVGQYLVKDNFSTVVSEVKVNDMVKVIDPDNYGAQGKVVDTSNGDGFFTVLLQSGERALINEEMLHIIG